jgi:tetratricopeptide (TPR) repeat protein
MKDRANLSTSLLILFLLLVLISNSWKSFLGNLYLNLGNIPFARAMVIQANSQTGQEKLAANPNHWSKMLEHAAGLGIVAADRNLGLARWAEGQVEQSLQAWQQVLQDNPDDVLTHFWVGQALLSLDRDQALTHLKAARSAWYFLDLASLKAAEHEDMVELVELAVSISDNDSADLCLEAASLLVQGDPAYALELVEQARRLEGGYRKASYLTSGIAYYNLKSWDESIAVLRAGLQEHPRDADFYYWLGLALWKRDGERSLEEAVGHLKTALGLSPRGKNKAVLSALGDIYGSVGDHAQSVYWYEQLVRATPNSRGAYIDLARAQIKSGNLIAAQQTLLDAIERWPDHERSRFILASVYLDLGKTTEACGQFEEALRLLPGGLDSYRYSSELDPALVEFCGP